MDPQLGQVTRPAHLTSSSPPIPDHTELKQSSHHYPVRQQHTRYTNLEK
jgi:hypothetical protein